MTRFSRHDKQAIRRLIRSECRAMGMTTSAVAVRMAEMALRDGNQKIPVPGRGLVDVASVVRMGRALVARPKEA